MSREYDDELFSFEDEALTAEAPHPTLTWQVLIVDDDLDVHQSTCFAMANTEVLGRSLEFLHATLPLMPCVFFAPSRRSR